MAGVQLILPGPSRNEDVLLAKLRDSGIGQQPGLRPQGVAAAQALVGARLGVGIVPALGVDLDDRATVTIPLPGMLPERLIALVRHRERDYAPDVRALARCLAAAFPDPGEPPRS